MSGAKEGGVDQESEQQSSLIRDILAGLCNYRIREDALKNTQDRPLRRGGQGSLFLGTLISTTGEGIGHDNNLGETRANSPSKEQLVVVKKFHLNDHREMKEGFVNELSILAQLSHPNIISLIGFLEDFDRDVAWMVFAWESNGNVREFLQSGHWDIPERISLLKDVSAGVVYLHDLQPPVCHGDLKSLNILVNSSYRAIITDFGSSRVLRKARSDQVEQPGSRDALNPPNEAAEIATVRIDLSGPHAQLILTSPDWSLRWAAPEVLAGDDPDLASDIWAFGWIGWEILTDQYPFPELSHENHVVAKVATGKLPPIREGTQTGQIIALCSLMTGCWKRDATERPSASSCNTVIRWLPSTVPEPAPADGLKFRSATLLSHLGWMKFLQDDLPNSASLLLQSAETARLAKDHRTTAYVSTCLADVYVAQNRLREAEDLYIHANTLYSQLRDYAGCATSLRGLGGVRLSRLDYEGAKEANTRAVSICARIGDDLARANALHALGDVCFARSSDAEAETFYAEAEALHTQIGHEHGKANALLRLGDIRRSQCDYAAAEELYREAEVIHNRLGHEGGRGIALCGLGDVSLAQGKCSEAQKVYAQAEAACTRTGFEKNRAMALRGLGEICYRQSNYPEAEGYFKTMEAILARHGDKHEQADALCQMGLVYRAQSRHKDAEDAYARAEALFAALGIDSDRADALRALGEVSEFQLKALEAEKFYLEANTVYARIGSYRRQAAVLRRLGSIRLSQSKYDEAGQLFMEADAIDARIRDNGGQADSLKLLGDSYRAKHIAGEDEKACAEAKNLGSQIDDGARLRGVLPPYQARNAQPEVSPEEATSAGARELDPGASDE